VSAKHNAVGVRAVSGDDVLTAAAIRSDGTFSLILPKGHEYRLELMLRTGTVKHFTTKKNGKLTGLAFKVCEPQDPWDMGGTEPGTGGGGMCTDPTDPNCKPPCDPASGEMCPEPPPPCDPMTDPGCGGGCDPSTGMCPPPTCTDPTDPNCGMCVPQPDGTCEPKCDPMTDPNCEPPPPPPPCDPTTGMGCEPPKCDPSTGMGDCPVGCTDWYNCCPDGSMDCIPPEPCTDPNAPGCAPPCEDQMDPTSCKDPCVLDPAQCGCMPGEPNCWPPPDDGGGCCSGGTGMCDPDDAVTPDSPPDDFGCTGME
jgi:hypothetical protein